MAAALHALVLFGRYSQNRCSLRREEILEFAVGGDLVDKPDEQIDVEVWDYHWVNRPGNLTWYDEWYRDPVCTCVSPLPCYSCYLYLVDSICGVFTNRSLSHNACLSHCISV